MSTTGSTAPYYHQLNAVNKAVTTQAVNILPTGNKKHSEQAVAVLGI